MTSRLLVAVLTGCAIAALVWGAEFAALPLLWRNPWSPIFWLAAILISAVAAAWIGGTAARGVEVSLVVHAGSAFLGYFLGRTFTAAVWGREWARGEEVLAFVGGAFQPAVAAAAAVFLAMVACAASKRSISAS